MDDYTDGSWQSPAEQGQAEPKFPTFEDGTRLSLGDKIRLEDGSLMRVETVAFSEDGTYVSGSPISPDERRFVRVDATVSSPSDDTLEAIQADALLSPNDYCRKRALDTSSLGKGSRQPLMTKDLLERQMAVLTRP